MNDFLAQFLVESRELVEQATSDLIALEQNAGDPERLDSAFRAFHTLKGGAGIVDFTAMSRIVHTAEDTLAAVRNGGKPLTPRVIGDCLACVDQVVQWLDEIERTGDLPVAAEAEADTTIARFDREAEAGSTHAPLLSGSVSPAQLLLEEQIRLLQEAPDGAAAGRYGSAARVAANVLRSVGRAADAVNVESALSISLRTNTPDMLIAAIENANDGGPDSSGESSPVVSASGTVRTMRVDAERVDSLVKLTGELTVAKNAIAHIARLATQSDSPLASLLKDEQARFGRVLGDLQRAVLSLRVLPLRTVFQRFPRVVREMSVNLGKPINLVTEGDDTEADKVIVEMLFEPLLHVVRNAVDHGIESPEERVAAAKPPVATIRLRAEQEGDHVIVDVSDDGRGIDTARVRAIALARDIVSADVLATMKEQDVVDLIFAPGFSTAETVTDISGRGVGMDVVRTAVERIGGRVAVQTEAGAGSTIRFVLPFSVMMTRVMTVESGGQMFGIPLDAIVETVRLPRDQIQRIGGAGAFVLRNRTIPLIDLRHTLGESEAGEPRLDPEAIAVVASISGQLGALEVDRLGERLDVMLKPVDGLLAGTPGIAGTTLTGDGQVLLILDLQELFA